MAQGGGSQAATVAAEQASQQPGNSLFFRGHEAEAVNQEQPEHILGKGLSIKDVKRRGEGRLRQASQQPGNSHFFRGHEAEAVNKE